MPDREKLIALLKAATDYSCVLQKLKCTTTEADEDPLIAMADHLLANGVTIQRWIPVEKRLPATTSLCVVVKNCVPTLAWYTGKDWRYAATASVAEGVTHWMPLPSPPKEVE